MPTGPGVHHGRMPRMSQGNSRGMSQAEAAYLAYVPAVHHAHCHTVQPFHTVQPSYTALFPCMPHAPTHRCSGGTAAVVIPPSTPTSPHISLSSPPLFPQAPLCLFFLASHSVFLACNCTCNCAILSSFSCIANALSYIWWAQGTFCPHTSVKHMTCALCKSCKSHACSAVSCIRKCCLLTCQTV